MDPTPAIDVALHDLAQNRETPSQLERHESGSHEQRRSHQEFSLPKADGGKEAWLFLAGCFFIEGLVWGFPFSYGVFQDYYSTHELFASEPSGIAVIGTCAMGIIYLGSPFCFAALSRWPNFRRTSLVLGLVITSVGLIVGSFSQHVWHLILTQGCLYAIGGTLLYSPAILFVDEWFIHRKGFAFGVMWAGTGFSGVTVPFIMSWALSQYSFRTTLRIWAIALVILTGPLLYYVKPRLPKASVSHSRRFNFNFVSSPSFLIPELGNILQGLGFFIPGIYLPTYARSLGLSSAATTATIVLLNTAAVFGCVFVGVLIDRLHVTTVIFITTVGATFSVFVFWGLSASIPLLLLFSLVYGFFAGSFSSTYTGIIREVRKKDSGAEAGLVFGLLAAGRGIGSVACGPLSEALLKDRPWQGEAALGYGTGYGGLIVFTGVTAMLGGVSFGARRLGWI